MVHITADIYADRRRHQNGVLCMSSTAAAYLLAEEVVSALCFCTARHVEICRKLVS